MFFPVVNQGTAAKKPHVPHHSFHRPQYKNPRVIQLTGRLRPEAQFINLSRIYFQVMDLLTLIASTPTDLTHSENFKQTET